MSASIDTLLQGAYDLHVHCPPDVVPRAQDGPALAHDARQAGMAGMLLKDHTAPTVGRVQALNTGSDGFRFVSALVLNPPVGGLNPFAVEAALREGVDVVYMPTYSARHQIAVLGPNAFAAAYPRPGGDWLGITGQVLRPAAEHPKRPVLGFECPRSEVSGQRLWGWARSRFKTPARFFDRFFVINYCPLAFLEASARNRTPDKLPTHERDPLLEACDQALRRATEALQPERVIGVGGFAEGRASVALEGTGIPVGRILHPSPANPRANRDWAGAIEQQLRRQRVRV